MEVEICEAGWRGSAVQIKEFTGILFYFLSHFCQQPVIFLHVIQSLWNLKILYKESICDLQLMTNCWWIRCLIHALRGQGGEQMFYCHSSVSFQYISIADYHCTVKKNSLYFLLCSLLWNESCGLPSVLAKMCYPQSSFILNPSAVYKFFAKQIKFASGQYFHRKTYYLSHILIKVCMFQ